MALRQLPGATVLGLVTALVAHAVLFGGGHAWGGAYHGALLEFIGATMTGLIAGASALLWSGARCAADGTVIAARIRALLPSSQALAAAATAWLCLGECFEPAHAGAPALLMLLVLAGSAWIVSRLAATALGLLAGLVFAIARPLRMRHGEPVGAQPCFLAPLRQAQRDRAWSALKLRAPPVFANA